MQDNDNTEYNNLSKDELIALLRKSREENARLTSDMAAVARERDDLSARNRELEEKLKNATLLIRKANLERFLTSSDNAFLTKQERLALSRAKPIVTAERKKAEKKATKRTYTKDDLLALSEGNSVIDNDILPRLMKEHPDWEFKKVGEDVSFVLERVKAHIVVHKVVTPKYVTGNDRNQIFQSPSVAPIPHSYAGPGLLADICTAKFQFGIPIYRYHSWAHGCGFDIPMRTLYGYLMKSAEMLKPIYGAIENTIRTGNPKYIGIDETYLKVIDEVGDEREHCYVYVLQCRCEERKVRFFRYTGSRESDYVKKLLADYGGTVVVDGYSGYDTMPGGISRQRCLCHLRRKFADIAKATDEKSRKDSVAYQAVKKLDRIFAMEESMRRENLTPEEILSRRNSEEYRKAVSEFREYVSGIEYAKDSPLGRAITYYLNGGEDFFTFLECGDIPLDNNETERSCKMFATNRRGFLFCRSAEGAEAASILTTVIKTAEANGLYPDEYLAHVFSHASDTSVSRLLPWSQDVRNVPGIRASEKK